MFEKIPLVRRLPLHLCVVALAVVLLASCASPGGGRARYSALPELPPGITADLKEESFAVFGETVFEIGQSLRRRGPPVENRLVFGRHSHRYTWEFEYDRRPGACEVAALDIALESTITMPRWTRRGSADPDLGLLWDEYYELLWMHEERHRAYAFEQVIELQSRLTGLTAPSCGELNQRIQAVQREVRGKYIALNDRFDANSVGAIAPRWPPR